MFSDFFKSGFFEDDDHGFFTKDFFSNDDDFFTKGFGDGFGQGFGGGFGDMMGGGGSFKSTSRTTTIRNGKKVSTIKTTHTNPDGTTTTSIIEEIDDGKGNIKRKKIKNQGKQQKRINKY